ncbi:chromosome segregation protein SMC [Dongia soli]|uniref:Chromosome partition protein Smc n=1 Tax=Dongia soli TaxID=600628 RepID=A0ABU5EC65_9PROT|nr:chromosome segregation protein SMC [Dongia soli]MDY0883945.1 chromosome segregation protein SMC [Dongia soli]
MVQFTKLRLHGFKSFVDHTELLIQPGMTGIVGPNGCGKSNLVEALRWAMGETSAKRMRGSEMDDVIFGGSVNRPARNVAEVTICLDNSDRKVPAQFNDSDDLEVSRRIDRGEGSSYKVNGKDSRARDVQLLFADSATGAQSTALVSQGRIGAIINAKPTDRRGLLEEAAGITGLHSRRHEAELRLKAAEANLARLDDVIVTLESQLSGLKKQARQASRYRNLNDQIRRAEAVLFHLQWTDASQRRQTAEQALAAAEHAVVSLTSSAVIAATQQSEAALILPDLRRTEAEAAAELQRLTIARAQLDQEEQRIAGARADADRQLRDIENDTARETALAEDAVQAQERLLQERAELEDTAGSEAALAEEAERAVTVASAEVEECESELSQLTQNVATGEARQSALQRRMSDLAQRLERLRMRASEVALEKERLAAEIENDIEMLAARDAAGQAEMELEQAQQASADLEASRSAANEREAQLRSELQSVEALRARQKAEVEALSALLAHAESDMWPPVVDVLQVSSGYEAALGAALGDDLQASLTEGAPVHWRDLPVDPNAPTLPAGVESMAQHVTGPAALLRRLSQIGVVADEATARNLMTQLAQGQRLVTRDGAMVRWDGLSMASGTPTAAVQRLKQKNRLAELQTALEESEFTWMAAEEAYEAAKLAAADLASREQAARHAVQNAYNVARQAREQLSRAEQTLSRLSSRREALDQQSEAVEGDISEAAMEQAATEDEIANLPDLHAAQLRIAELRPLLAERRSKLVECRATDERLRREADQRQQRLLSIARDIDSWQNRAGNAQRQLETYAQRREHIIEEIERLAMMPEQIAEQKMTLLDLIETATIARQQAADALAEAESSLAAADRNLKGEESKLVEAREFKVRAEAAIAQAEEAYQTLTERIRERLECSPEEVLGLAELEPGEPLPDRAETEQRLHRLGRERENIGPVNLRAEAESNELDQQLTGMQTEKSDLINAISRLRQGINSLNREGRERLLAAFELVNGHFEKLFTDLFGGGKAHLKLTEAEDPLEAGLEILASPPGKRLQVMSLLSGGEQALTALALLFAVFLVNPAPICVLDEVDAPLDDANVERFCNLVQTLSHRTKTRFLVITHHRLTMARMDRLFGVTMVERGISQLVSVDLQQVEELKAAS